MSELDLSFKEQQSLEDDVNLKAMLIQLVINLVFAICVCFLFSWLRPRYDFIYAPKAKLPKSNVQRPMTLGPGWFDWIKPLFKIKDKDLLTTIGFDAFIFIYFTRILKRLIIIITCISMFIFLPINVVATYNTGNWPPVGLEFLSITAMNYQYGKSNSKPDHRWFWSPTVATYLFSIIIIFQMIQASKYFMLLRQNYYNQQQETARSRLQCMSPIELLQQQQQELIGRTLLVHFDCEKVLGTTTKHISVHDEIIKTTVDSYSDVQCSQALVGKHNKKVSHRIHEYKQCIQKLEKTLDRYLYKVSKGSNPKRPQILIDWKYVDAINYYTERLMILNTSIRHNRLKVQPNNYAWIVYPCKSKAQQAYLSIKETIFKQTTTHSQKQKPRCHSIELAPHPNDIIWKNMNIDSQTGQLKRWFGHGLFSSIIFIWSIPIAILGILSNLINLIRLFPESKYILNQNRLLTGTAESYFTPCLMALFYCGLPELLHFVSRQQAYKTETVIQQKTLIKLYVFFIVNNLFVFSLVSIMVGIVGQIGALTMAGALKDKHISQYIVQLAKNMSDVSSFWINYLCIRSIGILFELVQIIPFIWIILFRSRGLFRYTPRQLSNLLESPPYFKFAKSYSMVILFFTAVLVYSVIAPIALPFGLVYFGLATITFKYKLLYMHVTKIETHGKIWPILYCIVMMSVVVFQLMMIFILSLKSGLQQMYSIIPLVIVTCMILIVYTRHLLKYNTLETRIQLPENTNTSNGFIIMSATPKEKDAQSINLIYKDPTMTEDLWKPIVLDSFVPLIPDVYKDHASAQLILHVLFLKEQQQKPQRKQTNPTIITVIDEKMKRKAQLEKEMEIFPPTPEHQHFTSSYAHYYQIGAESSHHANIPMDPIIDIDFPEPTAPSIQRPPPTYADVTKSPHKERRRVSTL